MQLIAMHSSWLAVNSVVGCTNGCKYCLFRANGNNNAEPKILGTPEESIKQLLNYKYYDEKIPVCLLPGTDAFLNKSNINYLDELLDVIQRYNVPNDLIIVTKCFIPDNIIKKLKTLNQDRNVVVYLSYSGLPQDLEPNVNKRSIEDNFKRLSFAGIKIVHYFRPFLPQNADKRKIKEILDFVNQYTDTSSIMGLKLIKTFVKQISDIWPEIKGREDELLKADAIWPEEVWDYFYNNYSHEQRLFQTNTCALNYKLGKPSPQYYNSEECRNYNHCSERQRKMCYECVKKQTRSIIECQLIERAKKIGYAEEDFSYHFDENGGIILENINASISDLAYLSNTLGVKVYLNSAEPFNDVYNSALNGAKPCIIKKKVGSK